MVVSNEALLKKRNSKMSSPIGNHKTAEIKHNVEEEVVLTGEIEAKPKIKKNNKDTKVLRKTKETLKDNKKSIKLFKNKKEIEANKEEVIPTKIVSADPINDLFCNRLLDDEEISSAPEINVGYIKWMSTIPSIDDLPPLVKYNNTEYIGESYKFLIACKDNQAEIEGTIQKPAVAQNNTQEVKMEVNIY